MRMEFLTESKQKYQNLKELSVELREIVLEKYPELRQSDIDFLTQLLGMELKYLFSNIRSNYTANNRNGNIL